MSERPIRVLYVEDVSDIAELAMMAFEGVEDIEIRHCRRGADALAELSAFDANLLLLDVMMPEMDGIELLHRIRALPGHAGTPCVFMTAKAQIHEQQHYLRLGALEVIVKPFDPLMLPDRLREIWGRAQAGPAG